VINKKQMAEEGDRRLTYQSTFKDNIESRIENIKLICEDEFHGQKKELRVFI
jgi:hypothetical protein